MHTSLRSRLYWLGLGIGLLFFFGQILRGYQVFLTLTLDVSLLVRLSSAMLAGLLALGFQMVAWRFLMCDLGVTLTWRSVIDGYMLSFLPRYIPGSVWGYLSRSEWLKRSHKVPYALSSVGSALEVGVALVTGSAVLGFYYFLNTSGLARISLLCFEISLPLVSWIFLNFVFRSDFVVRNCPTLGQHSAKRINFINWSRIFFVYVAIWVCYGMLTLILVSQVDVPLSSSSFVSSTFSFCISWLIGFLIIFFPSGLGIREIALANVLMRVMGIPIESASAISVFTRLCIASAEALWVSLGIIHSKGIKSQLKPVGDSEINPS